MPIGVRLIALALAPLDPSGARRRRIGDRAAAPGVSSGLGGLVPPALDRFAVPYAERCATSHREMHAMNVSDLIVESGISRCAAAAAGRARS